MVSFYKSRFYDYKQCKSEFEVHGKIEHPAPEATYLIAAEINGLKNRNNKL